MQIITQIEIIIITLRYNLTNIANNNRWNVCVYIWKHFQCFWFFFVLKSETFEFLLLRFLFTFFSSCKLGFQIHAGINCGYNLFIQKSLFLFGQIFYTGYYKRLISCYCNTSNCVFVTNNNLEDLHTLNMRRF